MKTFQETIQANGLEFVNDLMNAYTIVYEKINASTLSFKRIGDSLYFYKGRDNEEINPINSMLYSYFQNGIDYINRTSLIFYMEFPENWMFRLQYVVQNENNMINYKNTPKGNLILSCIDTGSTIIEDPNILKKWADRLQIDYAQPIFNGFLSEFQKEKLSEYITNGDLNGVSFSQYVISLLNPQMTHSALSDEFMGGIDSFVFKFYKPGAKKCTMLKLIDPYMAALIKQNKHEFGKIDGTESEVILANFIAYLQTVDISKIEAEGENDDERYIDIICKLFNSYIKKEQSLLKDVKGEVNETYSVNLEKIRNKETAEILQKNPSLTTVFQIITGTFMNTKDDTNTNSLISGSVRDAFNKEVDDIWTHAAAKSDGDVKSFKELMDNDKNTESNKVLSFSEYMKSIGVELDKKSDEETKNDENGDKQNAENEPSSSDSTEKASVEQNQKEPKKEDKDAGEPKKEEPKEEEPKEETKDDKSEDDVKDEKKESEEPKENEKDSEEVGSEDEEKKKDENGEDKGEAEKNDEESAKGSENGDKDKNEEGSKDDEKESENEDKKDKSKPKEEKPDNIDKGNSKNGGDDKKSDSGISL